MFNPYFKRDAIECIFKHCKKINQIEYQVYISEDKIAMASSDDEYIYESSWEELVKLVLEIKEKGC